MKRPFDHPRDMPTHVVHNIEIRDLPTLPRKMNWCYPELNMYAQVGYFPLSFQKELYDYYNESIANMCDMPEDFRRMQDHFEALDAKYGCPYHYEVPMQVQVDWHKWAHTRNLNAGYFRGDSYKWQLDNVVDVQSLMRINPPLSTRPPTETPNGLFPQNWPDLEEPEELSSDVTKAKILAALVMEDNDH
eukprot:2384699-Amphidinium_carterae.1